MSTIRQINKCNYYGERGHNKRMCKVRKEIHDAGVSVEKLPVSESPTTEFATSLSLLPKLINLSFLYR